MAGPGLGGFDEVVIKSIDGKPDRRMTHSAYIKMPLSERIDLLLTHRLQFFKQGQEVPSRLAMRG